MSLADQCPSLSNVAMHSGDSKGASLSLASLLPYSTSPSSYSASPSLYSDTFHHHIFASIYRFKHQVKANTALVSSRNIKLPLTKNISLPSVSSRKLQNPSRCGRL